MITINKIESLEQLSTHKQLYLKQASAPLDGMWLCGFIPMADHFGFFSKGQLVGYCCINTEGYLLQFYISPEHQSQTLFKRIMTENDSPIKKISGAFVSTAEPQYMSLCLDIIPKFTVHALMYQLAENTQNIRKEKSGIQLEEIQSGQLNAAVEFAKEAIGAPEEWLTGYFKNLINRKELFGYWQEGKLVATGESRGYDKYQTEYADLGFIVDPQQQGKGLGTKIFKQLITITKAKGLKPICSTEKDNIGAQIAISRAGFIANNRIVCFDL